MEDRNPQELLKTLASSGELAGFRRLVEPLEEYDRERKGDLIRTLAVFFEANANASEAADRLFLHRNSMAYRLERVRDLTNLDLRDHHVRLAMQLGLLSIGHEDDEEGSA